MSTENHVVVMNYKVTLLIISVIYKLEMRLNESQNNNNIFPKSSQRRRDSFRSLFLTTRR